MFIPCREWKEDGNGRGIISLTGNYVHNSLHKTDGTDQLQLSTGFICQTTALIGITFTLYHHFFNSKTKTNRNNQTVLIKVVWVVLHMMCNRVKKNGSNLADHTISLKTAEVMEVFTDFTQVYRVKYGKYSSEYASIVFTKGKN